MELNRREFIEAAAMALFAGVVIQITGCDSINDSDGSVSGQISANHGHQAIVTKVQLNEGTGLTLDIQGSSDHNHTVVLTAQDLKDIKAGIQVSRSSSHDGFENHNHVVTFN